LFPNTPSKQNDSAATMSFYDPAPKPASLLGYHRVLAPTAGIKCSPLCLGAMSFGTK
jgi:hypothetical protein